MSAFNPSADVISKTQSRLTSLGHDLTGDAPGHLGVKTAIALQAFQRQRGLRITGELDSETWLRLVEAGWSLGSRLLYLDRPLQRGDDVAELQEALAVLGFNTGRIDGIFGHLTGRALADFQRNCGLEPTGVLDRTSLTELQRLSSRSLHRRPVTETRDSAGLMGAQRHRLVVVQRDGEIARDLITALEVVIATVGTSGNDHETAALANANNAALALSLREDADGEHPKASYFASYRSHSVDGQWLVEQLAQRLATTGVTLEVAGMSLPFLRETMMPAIVVSTPKLSSAARGLLIEALASLSVILVDRDR